MRDRQRSIDFHMNYCQHYKRGKGADMICSAGIDLNTFKRVEVPDGNGRIKWGPCIGGHHLANPTAHCPHWVRRTMESAQAYADSVEKTLRRMEIVMPVVGKWRDKKAPFRNRQEVIECPECKGRLHLSQSSYNGHVWGKCETKDCVSWME